MLVHGESTLFSHEDDRDCLWNVQFDSALCESSQLTGSWANHTKGVKRVFLQIGIRFSVHKSF